MTNATPNAKNIDNDPVNHPRHYTNHPSGVECIEITRHMNFNCGNAVKYVWRADLKHADGGIEDLEKAEFYIKDEIARRKALQSKMPVTTSGPDALNADFTINYETTSIPVPKDILSKVGNSYVG